LEVRISRNSSVWLKPRRKLIDAWQDSPILVVNEKSGADQEHSNDFIYERGGCEFICFTDAPYLRSDFWDIRLQAAAAHDPEVRTTLSCFKAIDSTR